MFRIERFVRWSAAAAITLSVGVLGVVRADAQAAPDAVDAPSLRIWRAMPMNAALDALRDAHWAVSDGDSATWEALDQAAFARYWQWVRIRRAFVAMLDKKYTNDRLREVAAFLESEAGGQFFRAAWTFWVTFNVTGDTVATIATVQGMMREVGVDSVALERIARHPVADEALVIITTALTEVLRPIP